MIPLPQLRISKIFLAFSLALATNVHNAQSATVDYEAASKDLNTLLNLYEESPYHFGASQLRDFIKAHKEIIKEQMTFDLDVLQTKIITDIQERLIYLACDCISIVIAKAAMTILDSSQNNFSRITPNNIEIITMPIIFNAALIGMLVFNNIKNSMTKVESRKKSLLSLKKFLTKEQLI